MTAEEPPESRDDAEETSIVPKDPAKLAKEAMERARHAARQRGARTTSAGRGRADRHAKRRASDAERGAEPYSQGRDPQPMSAAVDALLRRMGWSERIEVASVTGRWRQVIGDRIADHCDPVSFDEGVLTVKATSTAWATQLQLMAGQIMHRINEEFGKEIVTELRVLGPAAPTWRKGPRTVKGRGPRDTYG